MIPCPNCKNEDYAGALFCSECGAQLITHSANGMETTIHTRSAPAFQKPPSPLYETAPESPIAFYLVSEETFIPGNNSGKLTLGRKTEGQVILPDIDLSPHNAYKKGISRLHTTIKLDQDKSQVHIIDLDSANGTRVNGNRIPANSEVPLHNNDIITLGKLKIQVAISLQ